MIPSFQRPESLQCCLSTIKHHAQVLCETLVVSVEGDERTIHVANQFDVKLVVQAKRDGFVKAANLGFHQARGRFILQLNDDCELLPHSIANAVRFLEAPGHEGVGQAAFFHNSQVRRNVHAQIQLEGEWFYVCHVRGLCYANFGLARRELYESLDFFDERFFMYGADPDFSLKIWHEAKLSVEPCPGALIRHAELEDERARHERGSQDSDNRKLFAKWGL